MEWIIITNKKLFYKMMPLFFAAITMGMIGSFHCIGMCGPIAFALPLNNDSSLAKFFGSLLYNTGRITTYSCIGLLFGLTGKGLSIIGFQQGLSILLGSTILIILLMAKWGSFKINPPFIFSQASLKIRNALGKLFLKKNFGALYLIGLLNGLLPCGLIYMAVAGAVATADPVKSALFMAAFGAGTLPVMWAVSFFGNFIGMEARKKIRNLYPYMMVLMACLLILRGMGLGIAYLSPATDTAKKQVIECYSKP